MTEELNKTLVEEIAELLENRKFIKLRSILDEMHAEDIALLFEDFSPKELPIIFRLLSKEAAAEVFVELDSKQQEFLIGAFSDNELKEVLEELYLDDTVDIIEEMPANVVKRILKQSAPETRRNINEILKYPDDSAGSIMTIELIDLKKKWTVSQAFDYIRRTGTDKETIYTCYVRDDNRKLEGVVSVKTLLLSPVDAIIEDIMETNLIFVDTYEDKEVVAKLFDKYDLLAMPVVDKENRLVGIITIDDAIDVIQDENTEDIEKMAAITPTEKPYLKTGIFETWKSRIPWLLLLMISATFTEKIIGHFQDALSACVVLTAFIPMLMGTGGNSGSQSSVAIIRGMSLHEIDLSDTLKVLWKEIGVSLICGLTLGAAAFIKIYVFDSGNIATASQDPVKIALTVSLALFATVVFAKIAGCIFPMLAKKLRVDPAVMASPFITTVVDAISLWLYFLIAQGILKL